MSRACVTESCGCTSSGSWWRAGRSPRDSALDQRGRGDLRAGRGVAGARHGAVVADGPHVNRFLQVTESVDDVVHAEPHAAAARPAHRHLLSALRRHGRASTAMFSVTFEIDRRTAREYHARFIDVRAAHAGRELRDRRRDDRSEGRSQQGAARAGGSRSVRPRGRAHGPMAS